MNTRLALLLSVGILLSKSTAIAQTMINIETNRTALILATDADSALIFTHFGPAFV